MDNELYDEIVGLIYQSAIDPTLWTETVEKIATAFHSHMAGFFIQSKDRTLISHQLMEVEIRQTEIYSEPFAQFNPWFTTPKSMQAGRVTTDLTLESTCKNKDAYTGSEMYLGWAKKWDFRHAIGGALLDLDGYTVNFSLMRPSSDSRFSDHEITSYSAISKHLARAISIQNRFNHYQLQETVNDAAMNSSGVGVIAINQFKKVEHVNACAEQIVVRGDSFSIKHGILSAENHDSDKTLQHAINQAQNNAETSTVRITGGQRNNSYSVSISPSRWEKDLFGAPKLRTLVFILDTDDKIYQKPEYLVHRWKLSDNEARFVSHMLKGNSVNETADLLKITKNTARWYVKQVMAKVGVSSQNNLILKLAGEVLPLT